MRGIRGRSQKQGGIQEGGGPNVVASGGCGGWDFPTINVLTHRSVARRDLGAKRKRQETRQGQRPPRLERDVGSSRARRTAKRGNGGCYLRQVRDLRDSCVVDTANRSQRIRSPRSVADGALDRARKSEQCHDPGLTIM